MSLSGLFGSNSNLKKITGFEIKPVQDYILYKGSSSDTPPYKLKGHVILSLAESLQTKGIRVTLEGKRRTEFFQSPYSPDYKYGPRMVQPIINKGTFHSQTVKLQNEDRFVRSLKPGVHKLEFEFDMPGDAIQSIEGMEKNWIVYDLKATVDRGKFAKDLNANKHVRLVRTVGSNPDDFGDPQVVEGSWPDKINYSFSTNSKSFVFGDQIMTEVVLTPMIAKLGIETIHVSLKENRKIKTEPGPTYEPETGHFGGKWKEDETVATKEYRMPTGAEVNNPNTGLSMYRFKLTFPLPQSLTKCRQTVEDGDWISIKHNMEYRIVLRNPDGHYSELTAHHAVKLFISPNLPVGRDHRVDAATVRANGNQLDELRAAPPNYGTHRLDRLYADVDPSGYMTPLEPRPGRVADAGMGLAGSLATEPSSMNYEPTPNGHASAVASTAPSPQELQARLTNLQANGGARNDMDEHMRQRPAQDHTVANLETFGWQTPQSGHSTREFVQYDMEALSKMPSYQTAVRTPLATNCSDMAPNYDAVTNNSLNHNHARLVDGQVRS